MNIAHAMIDVRVKRKRVDELLEKIEDMLDLQPHITQDLFSNGLLRANTRDHLKILEYAIAELADAEKTVLSIYREQEAYASIVTDGVIP